MTLIMLGWRTGISVSILEKIERGILRLKIEEAHAIAVALNLSPWVFVSPPWWWRPLVRRRPLVDLLPLGLRRAVYRGLGRGVARVRWLRLGR